MRTLLPSVVLLCSASLAAQADNKLHFPPVFATQEGDTVDTMIFGTNGYIRWQQADSSTGGTSHIIKFFRFRRDGQLDTGSGGPRTVDVELQLGEGFAFLASNNFGNNYFPGTNQVVLQRTPVSLPDWSGVPSCDPAPFSITLPTGFFAHGSSLDLIWDVQVWSASSDVHPIDATSGLGEFDSTQCVTGLGCNGFTDLTAYDVTQWGMASALTLAANGAPANQPVTVLIGLMDPNVSVGFCAPIHTNGVLVAAAGNADANGDVSMTLPLGSYPLSFGGFQFYSQAVALMPPSSLALSSGSRVTLPYVPPSKFTIKHIVSTTQGATTGTGPTDGGVIIEIDDGVP